MVSLKLLPRLRQVSFTSLPPSPALLGHQSRDLPDLPARSVARLAHSSPFLAPPVLKARSAGLQARSRFLAPLALRSPVPLVLKHPSPVLPVLLYLVQLVRQFCEVLEVPWSGPLALLHPCPGLLVATAP